MFLSPSIASFSTTSIISRNRLWPIAGGAVYASVASRTISRMEMDVGVALGVAQPVGKYKWCS